MYRNNRVAVEAPAKINLFLEITGSDQRGYHLLDTVMQAIDLCDLVVVGRRAGPEIRVTCSRPGIPEDESNLACRAAETFRQAVGLRAGVSIHIHKAIPDQAGLGGGSADAAAVLAGMNHLFGSGLDADALERLGLGLGADVPFLLRGGCCLARGVGEQLTPLSGGLEHCWLALAKPAQGISTREAYAAYDRLPKLKRQQPDSFLDALQASDAERAGQQLYNVFERVCDEASDNIRRVLLEHGALGAALSGSGSAVFGLFDRREQAEIALSGLRGIAAESFLARPVAHGPKIINAS